MLFPKLRATADLLMMKKELLTDRAIRNEMLPGLALPQICELLTRFRPDENDRQPLPPGNSMHLLTMYVSLSSGS